MAIDNVEDLRVYAKPSRVTCKSFVVTKNERKILAMLSNNGAGNCMEKITQKQIAFETKLQQSKVSYALDRLRVKGYILVISVGRADAIGIIKDFNQKK
jgi:DNA-binding MarR family transcriptional regulator